jgi:predicted nicotinamide N-methyase
MPVNSISTPSVLPDIPGGWMLDEVRAGDCCFQLTRPAVPDAFLDAAAVRSQRPVWAGGATDEEIPYWPYLWPAAELMAAHVLRADWPAETSILEIGTGIGLVGLAALSRGWQVTLSDCQPSAVELALYNARQNGLDHARGIVLDWRTPLAERFDMILGCDLLYETCHHGPILNLVQHMLAEGGECRIADPGRQVAQQFVAEAQGQGFTIDIWDEAGRRYETLRVAQFAVLVVRRERMKEG